MVNLKFVLNENDVRHLILQTTIDGSDNLFINLYNDNTE